MKSEDLPELLRTAHNDDESWQLTDPADHLAKAKAARKRHVARLAAGGVVAAGLLAGGVVADNLPRGTVSASIAPAETPTPTPTPGSGRYFAALQPSGSMSPTLEVGQVIVFDRQLTPVRGDVVQLIVTSPTYIYPSKRDAVVKRVVGLPGDTVSCPVPTGRTTCPVFYVNGQPWDVESDLPVPGSEIPVTPVTVAPGGVYVLGDARANSADSRQQGVVSLDGITGVALSIREAGGKVVTVPGAPVHPQPPAGASIVPAPPVLSSASVDVTATPIP